MQGSTFFAPFSLPTNILASVTDIENGETVVWDSSLGRFRNSRTVDILPDSGVVPGTYTNVGLNVNDKGLITSAISGPTPIITVSTDATLTGDGTPGNPLHVEPQAVTPTTVFSDNNTLEGDGSIGTPLKIKDIQKTSNLTGGGSITSPLDLADTGVVADTYTYPQSLTVDSKGRIEAVSSGTQPLTTVSRTANLAGDGTTGTPLDLSNTGVSAGVYTNPSSMTLDVKGRITAITPGAAPITSAQTDLDVRVTMASIANITFQDIIYSSLIATYTNKSSPSINSVNVGTGITTINQAGSYTASVTAIWAANATGYREVLVYKTQASNGQTFIMARNANTVVSGAGNTTVSASQTFQCAVGDTIFFRGWQNSGGPLSASFACGISFNNA